MSNRSSSKQHCLVGKNFPKKTKSKKRNKFKARQRREAAAGVSTAKTKKASPKKETAKA